MKMSMLILTATILLSSTSFGSLAVTQSPQLSPSRGEYGNAFVTDENASKIPAIAITILNASGASGVPSAALQAVPASQVTGLGQPPQVKLADGTKIPLFALTGITAGSNPSMTTLVLPGSALGKIVSIGCSPTVASTPATAALACAGVLSTDSILSLTQSLPGTASLPPIGYSGPSTNAVTVQWASSPGANAVIKATVLHQ
jgi:hypothetical protein